jgi:hypothetical protein
VRVVNSAAIVSAQQHLQTHIATLWVHIGNAVGERHLQRTAREVLVRLNRLSVWIVEESSTRVVRDTLPLLFDIVDAAIETEARVDAMSNCLALVQEARGAVAPVRAKLNVHVMSSSGCAARAG